MQARVPLLSRELKNDTGGFCEVEVYINCVVAKKISLMLIYEYQTTRNTDAYKVFMYAFQLFY